MWKKTLFIGGLLILSSVFFVGCTRYEPDAPRNPVDLEINQTLGVLEPLKDAVPFDFSEVQSDSLVWNYLQDDQIKSIILDGDMIEIRGADVQAAEVNKYFEDNGFQQDLYNLADGVYVGQVGFQKDNIVCTMVSGISLPEPGAESNNLMSDITVRCALFN